MDIIIVCIGHWQQSYTDSNRDLCRDHAVLWLQVEQKTSPNLELVCCCRFKCYSNVIEDAIKRVWRDELVAAILFVQNSLFW